jgi:hypothetical protein
MESFENVLVSILKCFYIAQDHKIVKFMALMSNNLSNSRFLCLLYLATANLKKTCTKQRKRKLSNILY